MRTTQAREQRHKTTGLPGGPRAMGKNQMEKKKTVKSTTPKKVPPMPAGGKLKQWIKNREKENLHKPSTTQTTIESFIAKQTDRQSNKKPDQKLTTKQNNKKITTKKQQKREKTWYKKQKMKKWKASWIDSHRIMREKIVWKAPLKMGNRNRLHNYCPEIALFITT